MPRYEALLCWSHTGRALVIRNLPMFIQMILKPYFNHSKIISFTRQLNLHGFSRLKIKLNEANDLISGRISDDPEVEGALAPHRRHQSSGGTSGSAATEDDQACYVVRHPIFLRDCPELLTYLTMTKKPDSTTSRLEGKTLVPVSPRTLLPPMPYMPPPPPRFTLLDGDPQLASRGLLHPQPQHFNMAPLRPPVSLAEVREPSMSAPSASTSSTSRSLNEYQTMRLVEQMRQEQLHSLQQVDSLVQMTTNEIIPGVQDAMTAGIRQQDQLALMFVYLLDSPNTPDDVRAEISDMLNNTMRQ